jgi:hypothetical protein
MSAAGCASIGWIGDNILEHTPFTGKTEKRAWFIAKPASDGSIRAGNHQRRRIAGLIRCCVVNRLVLLPYPRCRGLFCLTFSLAR